MEDSNTLEDQYHEERLCGACHKVTKLLPDEADEGHEPRQRRRWLSACTWWRCTKCEQSNQPIREYLEPHKLQEQSKQFWDEVCAEFKNDPIDLWALASDLVSGSPEDEIEHSDILMPLELVRTHGKQVAHVFLKDASKGECYSRMTTAQQMANPDPSRQHIFLTIPDAPFAVQTSTKAAGIEALLSRDDNGVCDRLSHVEATISYCEEHPEDLVVMIFNPLILRDQEGQLSISFVVYMDVIPALDPDSRVEALQVGFMNQLAEHAIEKHQTPKGREAVCHTLYASYKMFKQQHLECKRCCPTKQSRKEAREKLFDPTTATILHTDRCGNNRFDKIIHVDMFWPEILPEHRQESIEWLEDPSERLKVMNEIVGEATARGEGYGTMKDAPMGVQDVFDLLECVTGGDRADPQYHSLKADIDGLAPNEYMFTVHYGMHAEGRVHLLANKGIFRQPAIIMELNKDSGPGEPSFSTKIDLKKCAHCGKEEELSRSYSRCSRCQDVYYCSRDHQVANWLTHKPNCVKKPAK